MTGLSLEDFGSADRLDPAADLPATPADRYDDGYNAGWDDAMARVEADQGRIGERLAERLAAIAVDRRAAVGTTLASLEPTLRDIFDRLLPRMAQRAFLPILMQEIEALLDADAGPLTLLVAPEDAAALTRLLDRAAIAPARATVRAEPALSLSQALIRWDAQERRVDLEGVLGSLDDALDTFLATMDRGDHVPGDTDPKEAING